MLWMLIKNLKKKVVTIKCLIIRVCSIIGNTQYFIINLMKESSPFNGEVYFHQYRDSY